MKKDKKAIISRLNELIETCMDGQKGFAKAAEDVRDPGLKSLFRELGQERGLTASQLQSLVQRQGGDAESEGSTAGALHRGWIDTKAAITGRDDEAIIAEAERGEDYAKGDFEKALQEEWPAEIRMELQNAFYQVKAAHDKVSAIEKAAEAHK